MPSSRGITKIPEVVDIRRQRVEKWGSLTTDELPFMETISLYREDKFLGGLKLSAKVVCEAALAREYPDTPIIYQLFVEESARQQGVASQLMDIAEQTARENGANELLLCVAPDNAAARALYEKRGYEYLVIGGNEIVESVWNLEDESGSRTKTVQLMPMKKALVQA